MICTCQCDPVHFAPSVPETGHRKNCRHADLKTAVTFLPVQIAFAVIRDGGETGFG
jgi:hypothetical protein